MECLRKDFVVFLRACEQLSFSKAAVDLNLSQPQVSKIILGLEREAGKPLFVRHRRGLKITGDGEHLLHKIKELRRRSADLDQLRRGEDDQPVTLRIGMHESVAQVLLVRLWKAVKLDLSGVNVRLSFATSRRCTRKVLEMDLDAAFVVNPEQFHALVHHTCDSDKAHVYGISIRKDFDTIFYHPDMVNVSQLLRRWKKTEQVTVPDYQTIAKLVVAGCGLGVLPESTALSYQNLTKMGLEHTAASIKLIYRKDFSYRKSLEKLHQRL